MSTETEGRGDVYECACGQPFLIGAIDPQADYGCHLRTIVHRSYRERLIAWLNR